MTRYSPWLYAGLSAICVIAFVINVITHGTALGLLATGGLAGLAAYQAYRTWGMRRRAEEKRDD